MNFQQILKTEKTIPKVVFLDAMGTLFGLKGRVGEIYGKIAEEFGVKTDYQLLNQAFFSCFKEASPLAFPNANPDDIPQLEYQWWFNLAKASFTQVNVMDQFSDFSHFFETLYDYFSSEKPWYVYADVIPALEYWQSQNIILGVISNFDSRLHKVLKGLELYQFFDSITLSSYTGFAKPHSYIFQVALAKHNCFPHQAWHIGDSQKDDYQGATQAGIKAFLVDASRKF